MVALAITPINSQTINGTPVLINGLDPSDSHCIVGEINFPSGIQQSRWTIDGFISNGASDLNLNMRLPGMADLVGLANHLI